MANANSTPVSKKIIEAQGLLMEAGHIAVFIQDITLSHDIHLEPGTVTGFYFVMDDLVKRIKNADNLLCEYHNEVDLEKLNLKKVA